MGVLHVLYILQMVLNRAKRLNFSPKKRYSPPYFPRIYDLITLIYKTAPMTILNIVDVRLCTILTIPNC